MSKTLNIGAIWLNTFEGKEGESVQSPSIKLGKKGKKTAKNYKPEYDLSVEIVVKDGTGQVVGRLTDGYINLYAPKEGAPENLKYELVIPRTTG